VEGQGLGDAQPLHGRIHHARLGGAQVEDPRYGPLLEGAAKRRFISLGDKYCVIREGSFTGETPADGEYSGERRVDQSWQVRLSGMHCFGMADPLRIVTSMHSYPVGQGFCLLQPRVQKDSVSLAIMHSPPGSVQAGC
jgi:hypothetical protein